MQLRHLKYFLSISRLGSFTKAADELFVTQPTLSHQIHQLEEELGCELFDRSSRNVRLTNAGEIFYDFAVRAIKETENGKLAIQEFQGLKTGSLRIGVISALINSLLPAILAEFLNYYPGIHVKVLELPTAEMRRQVRDGELAFGIGYGPLDAEDAMTAEELFQESMTLIVSKTHSLAKKNEITLSEIAELNIALLTNEYVSRKIIDLSFSSNSLMPNIVVEMNSIDAILETVANSKLATIFTKRLIQNSTGLVAIPITPEIQRNVIIFYRENINPSPASFAFLNLLRNHVNFMFPPKPISSSRRRSRKTY